MNIIKRLGQYLFSTLVCMVGCSTETRVDYEHTPTLSIEIEHQLNKKELLPFTLDGVVVAPLLRPITPERTQLWLKLWSHVSQSASVRNVKIFRHNSITQPEQSWDKEQYVTLEKNDIKGIFYNFVLIGEVTNNELKNLFTEQKAKLTLDIQVTPKNPYKSMSFEITRQKRKHWITH